MLEHVNNLASRYRSRGIVIDTNILMIFLIGIIAPREIGKMKRTEAFTPMDAAFLIRFIRQFHRRLTTPSILAEAGNLLEPFYLRSSASRREQFQTMLRTEITALEEHHIAAAALVSDSGIARYGFTDTAIKHVGLQDYLVFTVDLPLTILLERNNIPVLNYNHFRLLVT